MTTLVQLTSVLSVRAESLREQRSLPTLIATISEFAPQPQRLRGKQPPLGMTAFARGAHAKSIHATAVADQAKAAEAEALEAAALAEARAQAAETAREQAIGAASVRPVAAAPEIDEADELLLG